jgi:hypothetical protein
MPASIMRSTAADAVGKLTFISRAAFLIEKSDPHAVDSGIEIRQVFEMEDFAPILTEEQIKHKVAKRAELPNQTTNK